MGIVIYVVWPHSPVWFCSLCIFVRLLRRFLSPFLNFVLPGAWSFAVEWALGWAWPGALRHGVAGASCTIKFLTHLYPQAFYLGDDFFVQTF